LSTSIPKKGPDMKRPLDHSPPPIPPNKENREKNAPVRGEHDRDENRAFASKSACRKKILKLPMQKKPSGEKNGAPGEWGPTLRSPQSVRIAQETWKKTCCRGKKEASGTLSGTESS